MDMLKSKLGKLMSTSTDGPASDAPDTLKPPTEEAAAQLKKDYAAVGQDHVLRFWDELEQKEQASLYKQLCAIDLSRLAQLVQDAKQHSQNDKSKAPTPLSQELYTVLEEQSEEDISTFRGAGLEMIAANKVAAIVMAGGQGTRLGSTDPKGCFNIGLPSQKSLFQLQAERILRLQNLAKRQASLGRLPTIYWYVMTSEPTRKETTKFFEEHEYFGLESEQVLFFDQGTLPCVDQNEKMLLDSKFHVAEAPDGNGGLYKALITGGIIEHAREHSIEHFHVYCVDNCLAKVADPVFIGWAAGRKLNMATKSVQKSESSESVGLVVLRDDKPDVVEYSEIDKASMEEKDSTGKLRFRAANIVQHYFDSSLLDKAPDWAMTLPHHIASKKIPFLDEKGVLIKPDSSNGIKLEQFVFDVFSDCPKEQFGCLEVNRADEFSPLKNLEGADSPQSSKRDLMKQGAQWVRAAGGFSEDDGSEHGAIGVEVSPLVSYSGEGLQGYVAGETLKGQAYIEKQKPKDQ